MNAKGLSILALVTVAAVGATAYVSRTSSSNVASDRRGQVALPNIETRGGEIASIELKDGDHGLMVERKDNGFVASGSNYPVKLDIVRDLVATAAALRFEEAKTSNPARYVDLGLGAAGGPVESGKQVIIKGAGGSGIASFTVGNRDASVGGPQGGSNIRIGDDAQTWLVRGEVKLPGMKSDWFDNNLAKIDHDKVARVELSGGDKEKIDAASPEAGKDLELANVPEGKVSNPGNLSRLSGLVESLDFQDVRKAGDTPAATARKYVAETRDGLVLTLTPVGNAADNWVKIAVESKAEASAEQAKAIAAKVDGREFQMPGYQTDMFGWQMADMTSDQKS